MAKVIGIGGCSRSGKSRLALRIKEELQGKQVLLLDMDDFVYPEGQIPKIRDRVDWECPESVNFPKLISKIQDQRDQFELILVEGILVFNDPRLVRLFDTTIWMEVSKETFLKRRQEETRWGEEPEWFLEHVWSSFLHYGQFPDADFSLSGEEGISEMEFKRLLDEAVEIR